MNNLRAGSIPAGRAIFIHLLKIKKMEKLTQKELRRLVKIGAAIDVTYAHNRSDIPENYSQIGYAKGIYGCNGMLLQGESGQLYAVTSRTSAIYIF